MATTWAFKHFDSLTPKELQAAHILRQKVFIVEQNCPYLDADERDMTAWHLLGWQNGQLVATCRVTAPGTRFPEWSIGRVVTGLEARRTGVGREMMTVVLKEIENQMGRVRLRISAQAYLQKFYESFGFRVVRGPYPEDDIPHFEMLREP